MTGTPKNVSNKIRKETERDNNEAAQNGAESAASLLRGGMLSGEVDNAARTYYSESKQTKAIHLAEVEGTYMRRRRPQMARKARKSTKTV